jgi:phage terminase large subunit-like protein
MTALNEIEVEGGLEVMERAVRLRHLLATNRPRIFATRWRCDRPNCNGMPHEKMDRRHARSTQVFPRKTRIFYAAGGRGSGKTFAGSHNFGQIILDTVPDDGDEYTEWAVLAPTYKMARDTCVEGPSGLIRALGGVNKPGTLVAQWDRSFGKLQLVTGAIVWVDGINDGGERIQGKNLYGAWCDEIGLWKSWKRAWDESLGFALRKGEARVVATGTPKKSSLAKYLLDDEKVGRTRLLTSDNIANLSADVIAEYQRKFGGTNLGRQELDGLLSDDTDGAVWSRAVIDRNRLQELTNPENGRLQYQDVEGNWREPPYWWDRTILAVDPSDGGEESDEQALTVVSLHPDDRHLYVRHSEGERMKPWEWLNRVLDVAVQYEAEVIFEKNHGGQYLVDLFTQVMETRQIFVAFGTVDAHAGQTKRVRAEGVVGLYEQNRVHHLGTFADLEDQMTNFTGLGNEPSPDRMDSLVWALQPFKDMPLAPQDVGSMVIPLQGLPAMAGYDLSLEGASDYGLSEKVPADYGM